MAQDKQAYEVTVTKKFQAWNDGPFTVIVYAVSKAAANQIVRNAYRYEFAGEGLVYFKATEAEGNPEPSELPYN